MDKGQTDTECKIKIMSHIRIDAWKGRTTKQYNYNINPHPMFHCYRAIRVHVRIIFLVCTEKRTPTRTQIE